MLICGILVSAAAAVFCSRFSPIIRWRVLFLLACFFAGSEILKQFLLDSGNDCRYIWWYFPFQLCSMPLYLLPAALFLSRFCRRPASGSRCSRTPLLSCSQKCLGMQQTIFTFLADFGTLAGIFAFCDTSGMQYQLPVLTVHSYVWHFLMIFTGILLGLSPEQETQGRFFPSCVLFLICAGAASLINLFFHAYGSINMFYISPWEPVTQAVFREIAAITGDTLCHVIYLAAIVTGAGILHLIFSISSSAAKRS
ncbi:MAG: hypothetical protein SO101_16210 [Lachnospiraceae bacterium]|nr:hypothetical protein [Lachnospiraceae bacterium]